MVSNIVTIPTKEVIEGADGSLIFRKPKASEMMLIADETTNLEDENQQRAKQDLKKKDVTSNLILQIEKVVSGCFLKGIASDGTENCTKEEFEQNFTDMQSVLLIFAKLSETKDLVKKNPEL
jgi:hypothetical protein